MHVQCVSCLWVLQWLHGLWDINVGVGIWTNHQCHNLAFLKNFGEIDSRLPVISESQHTHDQSFEIWQKFKLNVSNSVAISYLVKNCILRPFYEDNLAVRGPRAVIFWKIIRVLNFDMLVPELNWMITALNLLPEGKTLPMILAWFGVDGEEKKRMLPWSCL